MEKIVLISAFVLMILEIIIPGGVVFFLGLGALFVWLNLYLGTINAIADALTLWFISSLAFIFGLRNLVSYFAPSETTSGNTDENIEHFNQPAIVTEAIVPNTEGGRIAYQGTTWKASNIHPEETLPIGEKVRIIIRDNIGFKVERENYQKE